jgi:hypothetical protein
MSCVDGGMGNGEWRQILYLPTPYSLLPIPQQSIPRNKTDLLKDECCADCSDDRIGITSIMVGSSEPDNAGSNGNSII